MKPCYVGCFYYTDSCFRQDCKHKMKPTHHVAYNYAMALKTQRINEDMVNKAFSTLGSDNQIFALAEPIEGPYSDLVQETIGEHLFDWLMWWMYETDYGTQQMLFTIEEKTYNPTEMTLFKFLEIVDVD